MLPFFFFFFYLIAFPKNRIHNYSLTPLGVWNFWIQKTFCHTTSDSNIFKRAHFERESKTSMVSIANRCVTPMREKVFYFFRTDFIRNFWHTTLSFPRITKENQWRLYQFSYFRSDRNTDWVSTVNEEGLWRIGWGCTLKKLHMVKTHWKHFSFNSKSDRRINISETTSYLHISSSVT